MDNFPKSLDQNPQESLLQSFKPSLLPSALRTRVAAMLLASSLGAAPRSLTASPEAAPVHATEHGPKIEKVTEAYLGKMTALLAQHYGLSPEKVRSVIDETYRSMGSPAIYVHDIDGVRSFEGGPLKAMFIEREIFESDDAFAILRVWCAEGAHTYQWDAQPHRTAVLMGLSYGRATFQAVQEEGILGAFKPEEVQEEYDEFAYGPEENIFSTNEIEAHGPVHMVPGQDADWGLEGQLYDYVLESLLKVYQAEDR